MKLDSRQKVGQYFVYRGAHADCIMFTLVYSPKILSEYSHVVCDGGPLPSNH